jgi:ATP-binding cassette, subfamily A (ABC1), member 3
MLGIYFEFDTNFQPTQDFSAPTDVRQVHTFHSVPYRLLLANQRLAVVAQDPSLEPAVQQFISDMDVRYPRLNLSTVGQGWGLSNSVLRAISFPSFSDAVVRFDSEAALESYVKAKEYDVIGGTRVWAAIIFYAGGPRFDYAIRMNGTEVVNTRNPKVDVLQRGLDAGSLNRYQLSTPTRPVNPFARTPGVNPVTLQSMPGFLTLQLLVDRWILNSSVPLAELDPQRAVERFVDGLGFCVLPAQRLFFSRDLQTYNTTNQTARYQAVVSDIVRYIGGAERFAPQQLNIVPFPLSAYQNNNFYPTVLPTFAFFFVICFLFPVSRLIRGVVMEKEMKMREGMKMMGLGEAAQYGSWLVLYAILYAVLAIVVTIMTADNIFKASSSGVIWLVFFLFGLSSTTFSMLISVFFSRAKTASTVGIVLFFGGFFPFFNLQPIEIATSAKLAGSILTPTAFALALDLIGTYENEGAGVTSANVGAVVNNWSVQLSIGMMIFDTIFYAVLAWYLDNTLPARFREYGVPRPLNFPFQMAYWREVLNLPAPNAETSSSPLLAAAAGGRGGGSNAGAAGGILSTVLGLLLCRRRSPTRTGGGGGGVAGGGRVHNGAPADASYLEELDTDLQAKEAAGKCVTIKGLRKEFDTPDGTKVAVDDLDVQMFEGQIFVLLGHNGAGKTTTISMLTGLIAPTDGRMVVFGRDVGTQLADVRRELGVCPQHDVLWPELTVEEHLLLFSEIKEVPRDKVRAEIDKALREVGLTEKRHFKSGALSGGQKRKLSVCIALVGGSKVIFLDEPTSGMDPYSRRSTWQILQNAREGRVMLMTTHFMDEADLLGDRIGIMAHGSMRCCGSPLFLKQRFGVGYILTIVKAPGCDADRLLAVVRSHVPAAAVGTNVGAELGLRLPLSSSSAFPGLLSELDGRAAELGVVTYGVSTSDIQDVFMKIAAGEDSQHTDNSAGPDGRAASAAAAASYSSPAASVAPVVVAPAASALVPPPAESFSKKELSSDSTPAPPSPRSGGGGAAPTRGLAAVRADARAVQTGCGTFVRHFFALLRKRIQYARRDSRALCYTLLIPVVMTLGGLALLKAGLPKDFPDYQLSTAQFNAAGNARTGDPNRPTKPNYVPYTIFKSMANSPTDSTALRSVVQSMQYPNATTTEARLIFGSADFQALDASDPYGFITPQLVGYPTLDYQRMSSFLLRDKRSYAASKYGAYVWTADGTIVPNQTRAGGFGVPGASPAVTYSIFANTTGKHTSGVFANLMTTALYRTATGDAAASVTTRTHPLPFTLRQANLIGAFFSFSAATIIVLAYAFIPASNAVFVVREREVSAKHQQLISGVSIPAYWLSTYVFDAITYTVPAGLSILLCYLFDIKEFTDTTQQRIYGLILLFWTYGLSVSPFTYVLSYLFKSHTTAQNVVLFTNVTCMVLMIASLVMSQVESTCRADESLRYVYRLLPGFALGNGLVSLSFLSQLALLDATCDRYFGVIRPSSSYVDYDALDMKAVGTNCVYMAVESVVYFLLAIAIDVALAYPSLRQRFRHDPPVQDAPVFDDSDVLVEQARVAKQLARLEGLKSGASAEGAAAAAAVEDDMDVVLLNRIRKVYAGPTGGKVAVRGLSFGVPSGEVFGFLGINGAGKTTTLQMLSGDVLPTGGTALLGGYDIITEQPDVRRLLGYCPQHEALLDLLTCREHLELYARIKGVPEAQVKAVVEAQLSQFDLEAFANKTAGSLSGGNKRKLSVAIALIGNPPIVFLDEPSTGMDPVAKRFMWRVISRVATERKQCSIILTTHSMEEVEALCTRIGIMVGGRMRCLGSSQQLKNTHGMGYMAELKLHSAQPHQVEVVEQAMRIVLRANPGQAAAGADASTPLVYISRGQVAPVAAALGRPARAAEVSESGQGWAVDAAFSASAHPSPSALPDERAIPLRDFAAWWVGEDLADNLVGFVCAQAFPGSRVLERHGTSLRFSIPPQNERLSTLFAKLENARGACSILSYSLSQTSLEQIFNQFAAQQDEEKDVARGMGAAAPGAGGSGGPATAPLAPATGAALSPVALSSV